MTAEECNYYNERFEALTKVFADAVDNLEDDKSGYKEHM
jgi:hypothetical protein